MNAGSDELSDEAYREFLASGTESEEDRRENVEDYRKMLLGSLSDADPFRKRAL
jgi:hypothetical protein